MLFEKKIFWKFQHFYKLYNITEACQGTYYVYTAYLPYFTHICCLNTTTLAKEYGKEYGQRFYFLFLDCGMGGNSKQSVDLHVATILALWQKK